MAMAPFAKVARAGPLLLTSGFSGAADTGGGGAASASAYAELIKALAEAEADASHVARLDHFTASQRWLGDRQTARATVFGKPAPLASTGVATIQPTDEMLTVSAMAVAKGPIRVLAPGADHAMPAISAMVGSGPLIFVSGILTDGSTDSEDAYEQCLATIERLLDDAGASAARLLRVDAYAASVELSLHLTDAITARWPVHLPLGGGVASFPHPYQIEVNALAVTEGLLARGLIVGIPWAEAAGVLSAGPWHAAPGADAGAIGAFFAAALLRFCAEVESDPGRIARIELCLPDPRDAEAICAVIARHLPAGRCPALLLWYAPMPARMMIVLDRAVQ